MILKLGSKGPKVAEVQSKLGLNPDGVFGPKTQEAVKKFQQQKGLTADGIVGNDTAHLLDVELETLDTDNTHYNQPTSEGLIIKKSYMDKDEYFAANQPKKWLYLHHTAGGANPINVAKDWNNDTRGRIATQFIIGGLGLDNNSAWDGIVVECMPDASWAYHLGNNGNSAIHPQSVGIEICSWGQLTKKGDKFVAYTGQEVPASQVCDLGYKHRGYQYHHRYTEKQLQALELLIREIVRRHPGINIHRGLQEWLQTMTPQQAFEFNDDAFYGRYGGMFTHTNVRKDKVDCSPQPGLLDLIKRL
jgi:N-acetyl-anhydromuramyl-L-alanine amidase AmpD